MIGIGAVQKGEHLVDLNECLVARFGIGTAGNEDSNVRQGLAARSPVLLRHESNVQAPGAERTDSTNGCARSR